jgi:hypothetical protein
LEEGDRIRADGLRMAEHDLECILAGGLAPGGIQGDVAAEQHLDVGADSAEYRTRPDDDAADHAERLQDVAAGEFEGGCGEFERNRLATVHQGCHVPLATAGRKPSSPRGGNASVRPSRRKDRERYCRLRLLASERLRGNPICSAHPPRDVGTASRLAALG